MEFLLLKPDFLCGVKLLITTNEGEDVVFIFNIPEKSQREKE